MLIFSACWFNFRTRKRRYKSCRMFNVQNKFTRGEFLKKVGCVVCKKKKFSWETLSVTSRRGAPTSRRQNYISLPRRDVDLHVTTLNLHLSATLRRGFTRRDIICDPSLPRRDVDVHVATSIGTGPCHVATSFCHGLCHVAT